MVRGAEPARLTEKVANLSQLVRLERYKMKRVYLIGPITGLSWEGSTDWRGHAQKVLDHAGIIGVNPLRAKEYLKEEKNIKDSYDIVLSTARGITTRDRWDCFSCDVVLANLIGAKTVSIGTMMELAWADSKRKPIVIAMEKEGNLHDHSMVREVCGYRVESLEAALDVTKAILTY